jgi:hypothetical protein
MESFLKNPFQNPFGGAMNPSGGGGGVLEQIQEQVNTNGETLQSLQGGIGGLPSGNLPFGGIGGDIYSGHRGPGSPGTPSPVPITGKQQEGMPVGNVGAAPYDINNPLFAGLFSGSEMSTNGSGQDPIRAEYDKAVAEAKKYRETSPLSQEMLPGEMSFENFKKNIPGTATLQNLALVQSPAETPMNPSTGGLGLMTMPDNFNIGSQSFYDPRGIPNDEDRIQYGNVGNTRLAGPLDQYGVAQDPSGMQNNKSNIFDTYSAMSPLQSASSSINNPAVLQPINSGTDSFPSGMLQNEMFGNMGRLQNNQFNQPGLDPLFGRAFAGKPI